MSPPPPRASAGSSADSQVSYYLSNAQVVLEESLNGQVTGRMWERRGDAGGVSVMEGELSRQTHAQHHGPLPCQTVRKKYRATVKLARSTAISVTPYLQHCDDIRSPLKLLSGQISTEGACGPGDPGMLSTEPCLTAGVEVRGHDVASLTVGTQMGCSSATFSLAWGHDFLFITLQGDGMQTLKKK